jgi:DNA polymerase III epsilon subunit-like protein
MKYLHSNTSNDLKRNCVYKFKKEHSTPLMSFFVFDLETTGLPKGFRVNYRDLEKYDECRIVSICWIVLGPDLEEIEKQYFVIKPDGFVVPPEATAIHGISHEEAEATGIPLAQMLEPLKKALDQCTTLVAHNISFDFGALLSESFRANERKLVNTLFGKERACTMQLGKKHLGLKKMPKLSELYKQLMDTDMEGAHNAQVDTECCTACFRVLMGVALAPAPAPALIPNDIPNDPTPEPAT